MRLTVPCFTSGRNVTVFHSEPSRKNRPRYIHKAGSRWDTSHDDTLVYWFTVRRFTVSEIASRTDYSYSCIQAQLKRLGLYEANRVEWRKEWDRYILDGMSGADISRLTGVSESCVSAQRARLGVAPGRLIRWVDDHDELLCKLWKSPRNTIDVIALEMNVNPRTITNHARRLGLKRR